MSIHGLMIDRLRGVCIWVNAMYVCMYVCMTGPYMMEVVNLLEHLPVSEDGGCPRPVLYAAENDHKVGWYVCIYVCMYVCMSIA